MKTIVVYSSQTGFTQKYAEWLSKELNADIMTVKEALKKEDSFFDQYDAVIYGGWVSVEKINKVDWFTKHILNWKNKKLALFCVGSSPANFSGVKNLLDKALTDEQKQYAKAFYCEGGLAYEKMSFGTRMLMKTYVAMLKSKKGNSEIDNERAEYISHSFDGTDPKYIKPIVAYING
ncbi:flavodoxin domain-containing protein [Ruminococcus sp.]|uniref:flavodoxin domain-containing protein n=1 Tax=Ruminococcus sp. TaxID=41978 RepID=UPI001B3F282B|nr:flavodoxin domain-containing protein [Ruminococcus sp.]MBP5431907.1 flavodoxin [Ruminococcus sp.]